MKSMKKTAVVLSAMLMILAAADCIAGEVSTESEPAQPQAATESEPAQSQAEEAGDTARVSYLGPAGTYTEEAAQYYFSDGIFQPKETVDDAIADVLNNEADYAVIPQENTLGGAVTNYVDALIAEEDVYVVGEVILPINQTLMGVPGASVEDIQTVCSHAQGIAQSAEWRAQHLPDAAVEEMASTAAAASHVAEEGDKTIAAIAAPGAAELYGLSVLAENVQITDANKTRFYVLSTSRLDAADESLTHAVIVASCEANLIDDIIVGIHDTGAELVTIHDRPQGSQLGAYNYILELENRSGFSEELQKELDDLDAVQFRGSFQVMEKQSGFDYPCTVSFELEDGTVILTQDQIESASVEMQTDTTGTQSCLLKVVFDEEGKEAFAQATSEHIGEVINILINEEPVCSPRVQDSITGGECVIAGDFTPEEAQELAEALGR